MRTIDNALRRMTLVAAIMTTAPLFAEVVTWSGEAQTVSADTAIEALHVSAATTVTVADGCTLTVDELVGDALVTKAGNGTLVIRNFSANAQIFGDGRQRPLRGGRPDGHDRLRLRQHAFPHRRLGGFDPDQWWNGCAGTRACLQARGRAWCGKAVRQPQQL